MQRQQKKTQRELPSSEQPYERALQLGTEQLSDGELLSIILRSGTRDYPVRELSQELLGFSSPVKGLIGLQTMSFQDFLSLKGIGKVKAIQLMALCELSKRMNRQEIGPKESFDSPEIIAQYYMQHMRFSPVEKLMAIFLDTKNGFLRDRLMTQGTVNCSIVSPREIFQAAMEEHAVSIVLVHNHPSGDPTPSKEDLVATKRVQEAGRLLNLPLTDHIVIGDNRFLSMREAGYL